ncbi:hypothetical protein NliqN6_1898 [Naganishia liquefaciens]|uniref:Transmembrane protein n=1 Tax=Naganishia liquefaciens TaxID=104408 RepID=A0A8H3YFA3_9TREE|nr:hypothetical protein NliqN6_1898 [Naganishia liquefaciens]
MNTLLTREHPTGGSFAEQKPPAVSRDSIISLQIDQWSMSAYQRDTPLNPRRGDTIFRGSVAESPVPTLEITIDGVQTRFPAQTGAGEILPSPPLSQADSDPFSDYRSYESDQGETGYNKDEVEDNGTRKKVQPRLHCTTTFSPAHANQPIKPFTVTDRSPLDTLCRALRTPADLPQSPSPFSFGRMHVNSVKLLSSNEEQKPERSNDNWFTQRASTRRLYSITTSMAGTVTPNLSLPAAHKLSKLGTSQHSLPAATPTQGSGVQWYLRSVSIISCMVAAIIAVCLAVCALSARSAASLLATVPASVFAGLEGMADDVELHVNAVCLLRKGVSTPQCGSYDSVALAFSESGTKLTNQTIRLIDTGLVVSIVFAIMLAAYLSVSLLFASMLLDTLHLPISYFISDSFATEGHKQKLDQVYTLACHDDLANVFWLWFGHHHLPLDMFFLFSSMFGILIAVRYKARVKLAHV